LAAVHEEITTLRKLLEANANVASSR
jgi:hypothetical protein